MTTTIRYERLDMHAPSAVWSAFGAVIYSQADGPDYVGRLEGDPCEGDQLLLLGCAATGARDERAVVWAIGERARRGEERTRVTAEARMADAVRELAAQLGAESAASLVARMPERLRAYAEKVLHARR